MRARTASEIAVLLDRIDPRRFDVANVVDKLNEFESLTDAEVDARDEDDQGPFDFAGAEPHPFTALCGEAHNEFFVLRDLTGNLEFVCETAPASKCWEHGPLYRGNLSESGLEWYLAAGGSELPDLGLPLAASELRGLLEALPDDSPKNEDARGNAEHARRHRTQRAD